MTHTTRLRLSHSMIAIATTAAMATATAAGAAADPASDPGIPSVVQGPTPVPSPVAAQIPCSPLHVVGFQGTDQSGEAADPTVDSGFLGDAVTRPLLTRAPGVVTRQLVPYAADFGRRSQPYAQSMTGGLAAGVAALREYADRCPGARFAVTGWSQGGQIADELVREIGEGRGPILPQKLAAASIFSSPIRQPDAGVFPGAPGQASPQPPPGLPANTLTNLVVAAAAPAAGGGIAPSVSQLGDYGAVTGRVASWCSGGDIACATPTDAPLARTISNIAGQLRLQEQDPVQTAADLTVALGGAVLRTGADAVNDGDIAFRGGHFTIQHTGQTMLGRLAENSDPRSATPAADADIVNALITVGVMGFNAAVTVARKVLTPATIAELAAVGLANPVAGLTVLGTKLAGAVIELFPPATIDSGIRYMFDELTRGVVDNAGLVQMATDLRYWDATRQHNSYDQTPITTGGHTPAGFTVDWFTALARALDQTAPTASTTAAPTASTTAAPTASTTAAPTASTTAAVTPTPASAPTSTGTTPSEAPVSDPTPPPTTPQAAVTPAPFTTTRPDPAVPAGVGGEGIR